MATTAGGLPYPVGTDKVVDGDDAIKALAEAIESKYGPAGVPSYEQIYFATIYGPSSNTDQPVLNSITWIPPRSGLARVTGHLDVTLSSPAAGYAGAAVKVAGVFGTADYIFPFAASGGSRKMLHPRSRAFRVVAGVGVNVSFSAWVYNPSGTWTVNSGISQYEMEVT